MAETPEEIRDKLAKQRADERQALRDRCREISETPPTEQQREQHLRRLARQW